MTATSASNRAARRMQFTVTVRHDEATRVWYVHESTLPGLHAEATTLDELVEVIEALSPDLVATHGPEDGTDQSPDIPVCIQHLVSAKRAHAC